MSPIVRPLVVAAALWSPLAGATVPPPAEQTAHVGDEPRQRPAPSPATRADRAAAAAMGRAAGSEAPAA